MTTVHDRTDSVPGLARLVLRDPDQQERKIAQEHMNPDPLLLAMIERPEIERSFERPERPFHFHELFIPQGGDITETCV